MKPVITTATAQGSRFHQEDRAQVKELEGGCLLAIFDGHGGHEAAETYSKMIAELVQTVDEEAFRKSVCKMCAESTRMKPGASMTAVLLDYERDVATVLVLGDSPAFLFKRDGKKWISPAHNVRVNKEEREAAIARGGYMYAGYICCGVDGLQMARALGDSKMGSVILREPEVFTCLIKHVDTIMLCTDGVVDTASEGWESSQNTDLVAQEAVSPEATAQSVLDVASSIGLEDNATVILWRRQ